MSVLDIKNDLLRLLVETNDPTLLEKVRMYFKNLKDEPLSTEEIEEQKNRMIDLGLKQIEEGKSFSHEEARKKINEYLKKKSK